jgi:hypothetical protein
MIDFGPWKVGNLISESGEYTGFNSETGEIAILQQISKNDFAESQIFEICQIFSSNFIQIIQVYERNTNEVLIIKEFKRDFSLKEITDKFTLKENLQSRLTLKILNLLKDLGAVKGIIHLENLKVNGSVLNVKIDPFITRRGNDLENLKGILQELNASSSSELKTEFLEKIGINNIDELLLHSWILIYNQPVGKSVSFSPVLKNFKSLDLDRTKVLDEFSEFKFGKKKGVCVIS